VKRLILPVILLLVPALRAAELGKPGAPMGVALPGAPLTVVSAPIVPVTPAVAALPPVLPAAATPPALAPASPAVPAAAKSAAPAPAGASQAAQPAALEQVRAIRARLEAQLKAMEAVVGADPVLDQVRAEAGDSLARIEAHVAAGRIDPSLAIRTHEDHPEAAPPPRAARVGVFPVAADPFQWAHLLTGLRAMADHRLDRVIYVLAGDDERKPEMTPVLHRHPMGLAVLETFAPLFGYSPIAVGTSHDGETNIFRILALNTAHAIHAYYLVGGDHYQRQYPNGKDDTIAKLEKKVGDASLGHDPEKHTVTVAFIARGTETPGSVPTTLDVTFLPGMPFEASSTQIRKHGQYALMPHAAYQWVLDNLPGHYGITKPQ
jgi:hypothetical protein